MVKPAVAATTTQWLLLLSTKKDEEERGGMVWSPVVVIVIQKQGVGDREAWTERPGEGRVAGRTNPNVVVILISNVPRRPPGRLLSYQRGRSICHVGSAYRAKTNDSGAIWSINKPHARKKPPQPRFLWRRWNYITTPSFMI
jgi:hypothetical protein